MAEIIDLALIAHARRTLDEQLRARGLSWFLREDRRKPFQLEPRRVEWVLRTAAHSRERAGRPHQRAVEHARREVRRELIRRVVAEMLGTGL